MTLEHCGSELQTDPIDGVTTATTTTRIRPVEKCQVCLNLFVVF